MFLNQFEVHRMHFKYTVRFKALYPGYSGNIRVLLTADSQNTFSSSNKRPFAVVK
jgi:hypothetical protein